MIDEPANRLFVRVYTALLDDDACIELSLAAIGCYAITLLIAKRTVSDGRVPLRLLRRECALRPDSGPIEALSELEDAGLVTMVDDVVVVRSWSKYNATAEEIQAKQRAAKERRRMAARRANHERWHSGPFKSCGRCNEGVSPGESESDPVGSDRIPYSHSHSDSDSHSDHRQTDPDRTTDPTDRPGGPTAEVEAVAVAAADELVATVDAGATEADPAERRFVARAIDNGWTLEQLRDLAAESATAEDPRRYLLGCLRNRANEPNPTAAHDFTAMTGLPADPDLEYRQRIEQEAPP